MWDYAHSALIADEYDEYFAHNRLFQFDEQVVLREVERRAIPREGRVADLGCGTGRTLIALARRGYRGLAIDLSDAMLAVVRQKALALQVKVECVRANLVDLDAIASSSVDVAVSLFSTLGMIRGRSNRRRALAHVRRILQPGCPFVLHVHNLWYNLYDPGGPLWIAGSLLRSMRSSEIEVGDKFFDYRGVPQMFLHVFRRGELRADLRHAGFRICRMIPLDPARHRALRCPWFMSRLRANGWIVVCEAPGQDRPSCEDG
jgi:SAM-dependent methyltransferase